MFVNITEKPPWGSVIKAITYYLDEVFGMARYVVSNFTCFFGGEKSVRGLTFLEK